MMPQVRRRPSRARRASLYVLPSPVGGWNARDSIDEMDESDAIALDNLFPGFGKCSSRRGFSSYATGMTGAVFTLAEFNAGANRKFISAANNNIWNISVAGAAASLASGFTNDKWQWAQFDDASGGARMGLVNGADAPQIYNGTAVSAMTISGSGLTPANLDGICIFKSRSYFWDSRTQDFWYSAVNALGGALTKFPLGRVNGTGGNLTFMATWSRDGGDGADDLAVFALSSGDVLIYAGDNPGDANAWALVGRYSIGAPLSIRGHMKVGADLWIMTKGGYVPMSRILAAGEKQSDLALSSKIRGAVTEVIENYQGNYGWQAILYPKHSLGSCAVFNVPFSSTEFQQHVMNTATGAWCRFTGMNARCFGLFNDRLYFGGAGGVVHKADDGVSDGGNSIRYRGQTAWTYLKRPGTLKQLTLARLLGATTGEIPYTIDIGADFMSLYTEVQASTSSQGSGGEWDTSDWDVTDWPSETLQFADWHSVGTIGHNFSARLAFETATRSLDWYSLALAYEAGGIV